jgi:hypothetical protein
VTGFSGEAMSTRRFNEEDLPEGEAIDRYLWDGSGEPNAEVQRLERALFKFRQTGAAPAFPAVANATEEEKSAWGFLELIWPRRLAAIAAVAALAILGGVLSFRKDAPTVPRAGWEVVQLEGTPKIGVLSMQGNGAKGKLEVGQLLVTNANSRANITVAEIGELQVDPGSRVRLLQTSRDQKRIFLEEGTIHAAIWAPPGEFVVDTPSAVAVDLGCMYTLNVTPDGSGLLRTTLGWVGFHLHGRDSFIPAGAMCPTRRDVGPGTPYFQDAPESFQAALAKLDFEVLAPEARAAALQTILSQARKEDTLSLWHLLSRTGGSDRAMVYARFASLVPPPKGVTRDGILRLDQQQLDLWWNALGFGDISIWRFWEQSPEHRIPSQSQYLQKKQVMLKQAR